MGVPFTIVTYVIIFIFINLFKVASFHDVFVRTVLNRSLLKRSKIVRELESYVQMNVMFSRRVQRYTSSLRPSICLL